MKHSREKFVCDRAFQAHEKGIDEAFERGFLVRQIIPKKRTGVLTAIDHMKSQLLLADHFARSVLIFPAMKLKVYVGLQRD